MRCQKTRQDIPIASMRHRTLRSQRGSGWKCSLPLGFAPPLPFSCQHTWLTRGLAQNSKEDWLSCVTALASTWHYNETHLRSTNGAVNNVTGHSQARAVLGGSGNALECNVPGCLHNTSPGAACTRAHRLTFHCQAPDLARTLILRGMSCMSTTALLGSQARQADMKSVVCAHHQWRSWMVNASTGRLHMCTAARQLIADQARTGQGLHGLLAPALACLHGAQGRLCVGWRCSQRRCCHLTLKTRSTQLQAKASCGKIGKYSAC